MLRITFEVRENILFVNYVCKTTDEDTYIEINTQISFSVSHQTLILTDRNKSPSYYIQ